MLVSLGSPYIIAQTPHVRSYLIGWAANPLTETAVARALSGMSMLNRLGKPEEMGWIAAFMVSEKNSYMTGTTVESCGGATKYL